MRLIAHYKYEDIWPASVRFPLPTNSPRDHADKCSLRSFLRISNSPASPMYSGSCEIPVHIPVHDSQDNSQVILERKVVRFGLSSEDGESKVVLRVEIQNHGGRFEDNLDAVRPSRSYQRDR